MKVLVLGGAGYLGSVMCGSLVKDGHTVTAYDNLMYGEAGLLYLCNQPKFDFILGDVRDTEKLRDIVQDFDVVIHLVGIVGDNICEQYHQLACDINHKSVVDVHRICSRSQLVIFPATNSGYGFSDGKCLCNEDTPRQPNSSYACTKAAAETYMLEQPNVMVLRLATVFGPSPRMRADLLVNDIVYRAVYDKYITLYENSYVRNYIHIDDVADAFVFALCKLPVGDVYNVGNDNLNISKIEVAEAVQKMVPELHLTTRPGIDPDLRNYRTTSKKLAQLGFTAKRSLEEGIEGMIKAFKVIGNTRIGNN